MPLTDPGRVRIRLPLVDSDSAAADWPGFGCCRQIRRRLPLIDWDWAAADRYGLSCCDHIRLRMLQTILMCERQPNPDRPAAAESEALCSAEFESFCSSRRRICHRQSAPNLSRICERHPSPYPCQWQRAPNLPAAAEPGSTCSSRTRICLPQPNPNLSAAAESASVCGNQFGFSCCGQFRTRLLQTGSDSAAAHRIGIGCR